MATTCRHCSHELKQTATGAKVRHSYSQPHRARLNAGSATVQETVEETSQCATPPASPGDANHGPRHVFTGVGPRVGVPGRLQCRSLTPAPLQVSKNGHHLVTADGQPYVMQADTAWWLAERSTREDVVKYLDTRREQGYNVVMVAATLDGKSVNAYGQKFGPVMRRIRTRSSSTTSTSSWRRPRRGGCGWPWPRPGF